MTTATAASKLGCSEAVFRSRAAKLGYWPADEQHGSGRYAYVRYLWTPETVEAVRLDIEARPVRKAKRKTAAERLAEYAASVAQARAAREQMRAEIRHELVLKYPTPGDALPAAAEALHGLNRLAGNAPRYDTRKDWIYTVKNVMVRHLHDLGLVERVELHERTLPAKLCYECDGTGDIDCGFECYRCEGTGVFLPAKIVKNYCFYFRIGDQDYSWHQPEALVSWPVNISETRPMPSLPNVREHGLATDRDVEVALETVLYALHGVASPIPNCAS